MQPYMAFMTDSILISKMGTILWLFAAALVLLVRKTVAREISESVLPTLSSLNTTHLRVIIVLYTGCASLIVLEFLLLIIIEWIKRRPFKPK